MDDWIFQVLWKWQMRDETGTFGRTSKRGPNADVSGRPQNVRQRTSKRGPNADVSGRPQNVRQRTSKRGPNADVLKTSVSERQKEDQTRTSSERPPANVTMRTYCGPKRTFGTFGGRPLFAGMWISRSMYYHCTAYKNERKCLVGEE